ncbi:MAG: hypothetical protein ABDI07_10495 [Candidatus Kryptonium sp.]
MFLTLVLLTQPKAYIKIESMSPYRLQQERGITNLDSISTGLSVVGTRTVVWLSGWDVSGDTTFKVVFQPMSGRL